MTTGPVESMGYPKGLYLPDSGTSMPPDSLAIATNVDVTRNGTVKQRYGTRNAVTTLDDFQYGFVHLTTEPQYVVLKSDGTGRSFHAGQTILTDNAAVTGAPTNATGHAQMLRSAASTANPNTYVASPETVLYRYDGSTFNSVSNSPKCRYIVQCGWAERMLACGYTAGATNGPNSSQVDGSMVHVSNPSEPETWTSADNVSLSPGDGEDITAAVTYNHQTFVFKESSFFVFYGESGSGGALDLLYNQRSGVGCVAPGAVAVSPVGVFFLADDGIYLTDGGVARNISEPISGLFTGNLPSWTPYNRLLPSPQTPSIKFAVTADKLFAAVGNSSAAGLESQIILAYDYESAAWTYYEFPGYSITSMPWTNMTYPLVVGVVASGANYAATVFHPLLREDNGTFIPAEFQPAWMNSPDAPGYVGMDKAAIHRMHAWGAGIYHVGVATDYQSQVTTTKELDFGDMADASDDVWPGTEPWGDGTDLADEWGDGSEATDVWGFAGSDEVWGDGTDTTDVWGNDYSDETDLLRLQPPVERYLFAPRGRGNVVAPRFTKSTNSTYCYLASLRVMLQSR